MSGSVDALITCKNLKRIYLLSTIGNDRLELLFPDIVIPAGKRIALLGVSGSGKSTLLNLIAGLDTPDSDPARPPSIVYRFSDGTTADMADTARRFPRGRLGFVFQEGHLITDAAAGMNAALPGLLNGISNHDNDLDEYMNALKLPHQAARREAWRLSGGQKQRVALLRALFHQPQIIFADEPTSSLDKRMAESIMRLLVNYQTQSPGRTLFWATHDLQLAAEFATDFLIVRKPEGRPVELEGPLPNPGVQQLADVEARIYASAPVLDAPLLAQSSLPPAGRGEVRYTQAKVGSSLTFARRASRRSLFQVGSLGRWMASIESRPPPIARGFLQLFQLYARFSDHAVAGAVMMTMLMLSFVFLGLTTMKFFRDQAMSDPASCSIVTSAPDATTSGSAAVELTPSLLTRMNDEAPWRSKSAAASERTDLPVWQAYPRAPANPCGEARDLIFGRSTSLIAFHVMQNGQCVRIGTSPKTLVANLAEPTILSAEARLSADDRPQRLRDLVPQGRSSLQSLASTPLTGDELFVTEAFREQLKIDPDIRTLPSDLTKLDVCLPGVDRPLRIGGIISGLPQPRGLPYVALIGHGTPWSFHSDSYEQAVFYTHPERAQHLEKYLQERQFAFSQDEIARMIAMSGRFEAINQLIWLVGGIMIVAAFFFLLNCIRAFLEKNARPNAVLRAYGLTKSNLRRQMYWRLGAALVYTLATFTLVGAALSVAFYFVFTKIGLPLPSAIDILIICLGALAFTVVVIFLVVRLGVLLWWRKHGNIAQELS
jgi:putative ABC transport system ATP-binding protein